MATNVNIVTDGDVTQTVTSGTKIAKVGSTDIYAPTAPTIAKTSTILKGDGSGNAIAASAGDLPLATGSVRGAVNPSVRDETTQTQSVGVDSNGKLWTVPCGSVRHIFEGNIELSFVEIYVRPGNIKSLVVYNGDGSVAGYWEDLSKRNYGDTISWTHSESTLSGHVEYYQWSDGDCFDIVCDGDLFEVNGLVSLTAESASGAVEAIFWDQERSEYGASYYSTRYALGPFLEAGNNITLTRDGNTTTIAASGGGTTTNALVLQNSYGTQIDTFNGSTQKVLKAGSNVTMSKSGNTTTLGVFGIGTTTNSFSIKNSSGELISSFDGSAQKILKAGDNITLTQSGNTTTIAASGGGGGGGVLTGHTLTVNYNNMGSSHRLLLAYADGTSSCVNADWSTVCTVVYSNVVGYYVCLGTDYYLYAPQSLHYIPADESISMTCGCFIKGTCIRTMEGSVKRIENISYDDTLLTWDFDRGCKSAANPCWIQKEFITSEMYEVEFASGRKIGVVGIGKTGRGHRFYDIDRAKFKFMPCAVGDATVDIDGKVDRIVRCTVVNHEDIDLYNVITAHDFNLYANGILTSCVLSNMYDIDTKKHVYLKDGREIVPYGTFAEELARVSDVPGFVGMPEAESRRFYEELRVGEQRIKPDRMASYVAKLFVNMKERK